MPKIAIVDDRKALRETVKINVDLELENGWSSIDIDPFGSLDDYIPWINQNEIGAIILDERLNEKIESKNHYVDYLGHDLVDYIRKRLYTFPLFVITSFPEDASLQKRFKDVEGILKREEFSKNPELYVPRFMRSAQKFLDTFADELSELSSLATDIALGDTSKSKIEKISIIQTKIGSAFPSEVFVERSKVLNECEQVLNELNLLKKKLSEDLKRRS